MLDRLTPNPGSHKPRRRKGRGIGSGHGRTCGRGQKGAGARSSARDDENAAHDYFEGFSIPRNWIKDLRGEIGVPPEWSKRGPRNKPDN